MDGQVNLKHAVNGTIRYVDQARNKTYKLNPKVAVLFVRPRGWHLEGEKSPLACVAGCCRQH